MDELMIGMFATFPVERTSPVITIRRAYPADPTARRARPANTGLQRGPMLPMRAAATPAAGPR